MERFRIDLLEIQTRASRAHDRLLAVEVVLTELASQLRPHVPGAENGEGLEALLGRLFALAQRGELAERMLLEGSK